MAENETDVLPDLKQGERIKEVYMVVQKLGQGGFGAVYTVCHVDTKEKFAMKVENVKEKVKVLKIEVIIMKALEESNAKHVPRVIDRGKTSLFNFMIMTLLGPTINDIRKSRQTLRLSMSTSLRVGKQCIVSILDLHNVGFLHRDIKPANYCIGRKSNDTHRIVYMLDYGLARKYIEDNGTLKEPRAKAGFRGTLRYAPVVCHKTKEMSRKDDLETWMYMQVEITTGKLPWRELVEREHVGKAKELCRKDKTLFKTCPDIYSQIMDMIDATQFYDAPEYEKILNMLNTEQTKGHWQDEDQYDWEVDFKEMKGKIQQQQKKMPSHHDDRRQKYKPSNIPTDKANPTGGGTTLNQTQNEVKLEVINWRKAG